MLFSASRFLFASLGLFFGGDSEKKKSYDMFAVGEYGYCLLILDILKFFFGFFFQRFFCVFFGEHILWEIFWKVNEPIFLLTNPLQYTFLFFIHFFSEFTSFFRMFLLLKFCDDNNNYKYSQIYTMRRPEKSDRYKLNKVCAFYIRLFSA